MKEKIYSTNSKLNGNRSTDSENEIFFQKSKQKKLNNFRLFLAIFITNILTFMMVTPTQENVSKNNKKLASEKGNITIVLQGKNLTTFNLKSSTKIVTSILNEKQELIIPKAYIHKQIITVDHNQKQSFLLEIPEKFIKKVISQKDLFFYPYSEKLNQLKTVKKLKRKSYEIIF